MSAGEKLTLVNDLSIVDSDGHPTGEVIPAGSVWIVLPGVTSEPNVVWLEEPSGSMHTWDETVLEYFRRVV